MPINSLKSDSVKCSLQDLCDVLELERVTIPLLIFSTNLSESNDNNSYTHELHRLQE